MTTNTAQPQRSAATLNKLNKIHHAINYVSGGLVLAIVKRNLSKAETKQWVQQLRQAADDLEAVIK